MGNDARELFSDPRFIVIFVIWAIAFVYLIRVRSMGAVGCAVPMVMSLLPFFLPGGVVSWIVGSVAVIAVFAVLTGAGGGFREGRGPGDGDDGGAG
jgi:hypothetical protein